MQKFLLSLLFLFTNNIIYSQKIVPYLKQNNKFVFVDSATQIQQINTEFDFVKPFDKKIAIVCNNNKFGCINTFGKILIPLIYDKIYDYSEGLIGVELNNKLGFVDTNGTTIIPLIYETTSWNCYGVFYDGLAGLKLNDKFGFIDKNGKTIIPFIYDKGGRFSEGLANVSSSDKWGFIDKKGKVVIPLKFEFVDCFSEGFATYGARVSGRTRYGIINKKAEIILTPSDYKGIGRFSSGLTWAVKAENNKMVCLDKKGNQAFPKIFGDCDFFKSGNNEKYFSIGLSPICSDENKYGFVNKKGEVIIPFKYSSATVFNNGFSLVKINWDGAYFYIDKNGKEYKDAIKQTD